MACVAFDLLPSKGRLHRLPTFPGAPWAGAGAIDLRDGTLFGLAPSAPRAHAATYCALPSTSDSSTSKSSSLATKRPPHAVRRATTWCTAAVGPAYASSVAAAFSTPALPRPPQHSSSPQLAQRPSSPREAHSRHYHQARGLKLVPFRDSTSGACARGDPELPTFSRSRGKVLPPREYSSRPAPRSIQQFEVQERPLPPQDARGLVALSTSATVAFVARHVMSCLINLRHPIAMRRQLRFV